MRCASFSITLGESIPGDERPTRRTASPAHPYVHGRLHLFLPTCAHSVRRPHRRHASASALHRARPAHPQPHRARSGLAQHPALGIPRASGHHVGPFWAYAAGIGANAIAPFRGGDVVRVYAARRLLVGASVATIVSTLLAETMFGLIVVHGTRRLGRVDGCPASDRAAARREGVRVHVLRPARLARCVRCCPPRNRRCRRPPTRREAGPRPLPAHRRWLPGLHPPSAFLHQVALPQLVDWVLRGATAYALLAAFGVHPSVHAAVLVLVIDSVATAIPLTPGGAGAQQALLAFALAGAASQSQILAYSVGQQAVITIANICLGLVAPARVRELAHRAPAACRDLCSLNVRCPTRRSVDRQFRDSWRVQACAS